MIRRAPRDVSAIGLAYATPPAQAVPIGQQPAAVQNTVNDAIAGAAEPGVMTPQPIAASEAETALKPSTITSDLITPETGVTGIGPFNIDVKQDGFTVSRILQAGAETSARQKQVYIRTPAGPGKVLITFMVYADDAAATENNVAPPEPEHAHDMPVSAPVEDTKQAADGEAPQEVA